MLEAIVAPGVRDALDRPAHETEGLRTDRFARVVARAMPGDDMADMEREEYAARCRADAGVA